ncbi:MAG: hypothetical protein ABJ360_22285 [Roseobacter sp.]
MEYVSSSNEADKEVGFLIPPQIAYLCELQVKRTLAECPGIYVLIDGPRLYCGCSHNLKVRFPNSRKKQGFAKKVLCFPVQSERIREVRHILDDLEAKAISALFTLINGHGLPFELANSDHACFLPSEAWSSPPSELLKVAICIAQTVLYSTGVPQAAIDLPRRDLLGTALYSVLRSYNTANWKHIVSSELRKRNKPGHPSSPIPIVHVN